MNVLTIFWLLLFPIGMFYSLHHINFSLLWLHLFLGVFVLFDVIIMKFFFNFCFGLVIVCVYKCNWSLCVHFLSNDFTGIFSCNVLFHRILRALYGLDKLTCIQIILIFGLLLFLVLLMSLAKTFSVASNSGETGVCLGLFLVREASVILVVCVVKHCVSWLAFAMLWYLLFLVCCHINSTILNFAICFFFSALTVTKLLVFMVWVWNVTFMTFYFLSWFTLETEALYLGFFSYRPVFLLSPPFPPFSLLDWYLVF